jgi:hypothetical protein
VHAERRYPLRDRKASSRMDRDRWQEAMQAELQSLQEHGAWSIVEKLENNKVIPCKWVFKLKNGTDDVPGSLQGSTGSQRICSDIR